MSHCLSIRTLVLYCDASVIKSDLVISVACSESWFHLQAALLGWEVGARENVSTMLQPFLPNISLLCVCLFCKAGQMFPLGVVFNIRPVLIFSC